MEPKRGGSSDSKAIQQNVPPEETSVSDKNIVLRSTMVMSPKSVNTGRARVVDKDVCLSRLPRRQKNSQERWTYAFEIPMNDFELVEVGHTRHDLRGLHDIDESMEGSEIASGLTNLKRFAFGIGPCVLYHIPSRHPLSENAKTTWVCRNRNPEQRQDVRMGQMFPADDLSTQPPGES